MPQARIRAFHSGHVCLAHNLVTVWNKLGIHFEAVSHIEETLPKIGDSPQERLRQRPQRLKG